MRAALRTSRLLAPPRAWSSTRRPYSLVTRCVDASPKDVKRAAAGGKRLEADANEIAENLNHASAVASTSSGVTSPRAQRTLGRLSKYAAHGDTITGFFEPGLLDLYLTLDATQTRLGASGPLCEIGVYHGKSFVPLALMRQKNENAIAIDCFEDQAVNLDNSGEGDRGAFTRNVEEAMRVCGVAEEEDDGDDINDWLQILQMDSAKLENDASPLTAATCDEKIRIFSIDGCHTADATVSDLHVASDSLHPNGVVIVDDVFNPDWPGVVSGIFNWRADVNGKTSGNSTANDPLDSSWHSHGLEPFAIGFGKVFMSRPGVRDLYFEEFCGISKQSDEKKEKKAMRKTAQFMDRECAVFRHGWISTFHGNE